MKKSIALIVAITLCLTAFLCGCTNSINEDTTTAEPEEITNAEAQGEFCRVVCKKDDGIVVWTEEYEHIYVKNVDISLEIKPLQTVVIDFSEKDLEKANGTFTDSFGDEQTYSYILKNPKSIRNTTAEEPTFG
ncbi:MAG: hypothetical protein IKB12_04045 [Clostridia bacterium]|nr:hypothetical protein [Clostridia bacterium]